MQLSSIIAFGVLGSVGVLGLSRQPCQETASAAATSTEGRSTDFFYGGAPVPTNSPNTYFGELAKRQQVGGSACGIVSTATTLTNTCPIGYTCGVNSAINYYGCCVTGQCYYPTSCYDSTRAVSISCGVNNAACTASSLYCTSSLYPYCGKFILGSLSAYGCFTGSGSTQVLLPYTAGAGVVSSSSSRISSSSASLTSSSLTSSITSSSSANAGSTISNIGFSQQQQTVGTTSTQSTSTSKALAAGFGATGEYMYGLLMSIVLLIV